MFKGQKCRVCKVKETKDGFIYFANPRGVRVHIKSKTIEYLRRRGSKSYEPAGIYNTGKLGKCFYADGETWQVSRILATAFVPNPNGYVFVNFNDGNNQNIDISNLSWQPTPNRQINSAFTSFADRQALEGLKDHKEYQNKYNALVGSDGLNHAKRFVERQRALGRALLNRKVSPTGKGVWLPKELLPLYRKDYNTGKILIKEVYDSWIEKINSTQTQNKRMSPRLDFDSFVKEYNEIH